MRANAAASSRFDAFKRRVFERPSRAHAALWSELKGRRMLGYRFERRTPVDRYVVDFYCRELNLAVDVLGAPDLWHDRCVERERTIRLRLSGVHFLPFTAEEILHNPDGVVSRIRQAIRHLPLR